MLQVAGLDHRFGSRQELRQIDLQVDAGQIVVIMGPNGAGKTTLLRLLAGILPVQQGSLRFEGALVADEQARSQMRARIGLLTEVPGLYEQLSVEENLRVFARLQGMSRADIEARILELTAQFQLRERLLQPVSELSKGIKQRVALLRAVLHRPRLLLLDEPTSGLDPQAAAELHGWVARLSAQGVAVVLATHDFAEAQQLTADILVLNQSLVRLSPPEYRLYLQLDRPAHWAQWLRERAAMDVVVELLQGSDEAQLAVQLQTQAQVPVLTRLLVEAGASVHQAHWRPSDPLLRYEDALRRIARAA